MYKVTVVIARTEMRDIVIETEYRPTNREIVEIAHENYPGFEVIDIIRDTDPIIPS